MLERSKKKKTRQCIPCSIIMRTEMNKRHLILINTITTVNVTECQIFRNLKNGV